MITFDQMKDKLLTVDQAKEILACTEPVRGINLPIGNTKFFLQPSWNHASSTLEGTDLVAASAVVNRTEFALTKDGLLDAASKCGLPRAYVLRTPADLIEAQLNYWYGGGLNGAGLKMLVTKDVGAAVTRDTITPFSNLRLLDEVLAGIEEKYGRGDVYVDKKFQHSLNRTHLRLVIPATTFTVEDTGILDDQWSLGINLRNSLTGAAADQTSLEGYLFRWWCTNGAIDKQATSGRWNRRSAGQEESAVFEWARKSVDDVLGGLETAFDSLQGMARTPLGSDASHILRDAFKAHKIPLKDRERVMQNLVGTDQTITAYTLMNALTAVANLEDRDADDRQRLLEAGGDLPHALADRCESCKRVLPN